MPFVAVIAPAKTGAVTWPNVHPYPTSTNSDKYYTKERTANEPNQIARKSNSYFFQSWHNTRNDQLIGKELVIMVLARVGPV